MLTQSQKDLIKELLSDYIDRSTTPNQCQVCGAYQSDHTHEDCPVKVASALLKALEE